MNLDTDLIPFTKIKSKWITYLKPQEGNIGENLGDGGFGDDFLDTAPKAWSMKEKIGNLHFITINCSAKDTV